MADTRRYWDGEKWTDNVVPMNDQSAQHSRTGRQPQVVAALVLAGTAIGLVMSLQSASLLTGTGTLWTGVAIACGAAIASWAMRESLSTWVRVVAIVAAIIAFANVLSVESQLDDMRQEISDLFP